MLLRSMRGSPKNNGKIMVTFWGPHNKDYNILGSILGSPYSGKLPKKVLGLKASMNVHIEKQMQLE